MGWFENQTVNSGDASAPLTADAARQKAEALIRSGRLTCSEAVFSVVNEWLGYPLPAETVRLASGFSEGIGSCGCVCGALSGGVMALGLVFGRSQPGAQMHNMSQSAKKLHKQFMERQSAVCCRILNSGGPLSFLKKSSRCVTMTGEVTADVIDLISEYRHSH